MQSILDLGADVDSRYVMVACAAGSFKPHRIANEPKAIRAWLCTVSRGSRLAMESTGSYHELLADLAHQAGMQVYIVNARDLRRYGQGIGRRGKTDRIDAEVIARYIAREHEGRHAYVPPSNEQRLLARLIGRRARLVQAKGGIRQSLGGVAALQGEARRLIGRSPARVWAIVSRGCRIQRAMPLSRQPVWIHDPKTQARKRAVAG